MAFDQLPEYPDVIIPSPKRSRPFVTAVILTALGIAAIVCLTGCDDPVRARRALDSAGYSDITVGGHDWWACADSDDYSTHFRARNPAGRMVEGTVCSSTGWGKGATIRF